MQRRPRTGGAWGEQEAITHIITILQVICRPAAHFLNVQLFFPHQILRTRPLQQNGWSVSCAWLGDKTSPCVSVVSVVVVVVVSTRAGLGCCCKLVLMSV